jgi:FMN phosphatase YigB (HAD superfamily)
MEGQERAVDLAMIKAVIFDVDGTLYDQGQLRRRMMASLLAYYAMRPWRIRELAVLQAFRAEREKMAGHAGDIENAQYRWCSARTGHPEVEVRRIVGRWIFEEPGPLLKECVYPGAARFMNALRTNGIKVAIYSDYKAHDKLKAMGLWADLVVASTDPEVDRLKPDPAGLHVVARRLGVPAEECLFIGDRQEMDGECARRAGMPYLIIGKGKDASEFYDTLTRDIGSTSNETIHGTSIDAA